MSAERLHVYLQDIRQIASETIDFVRLKTKDEFLVDLVRQRAVAMNLLIIGETTARIMEEFPAFVADFPDIPWVKMRHAEQDRARLYEYQSGNRVGYDTDGDTGSSGQTLTSAKLACPR
nr:HepT-like ribonuclease domain-containing protein [uncultured Agrobacterium sp.]